MEEAFAQQYKVTLLPTNFDKALEKDYLEEFAAKGFDGLIVITRANHIETFRPILKMVLSFFVKMPAERMSHL